MTEETRDFRQAWQNLLQECALAADYHIVYRVSGSPLTRNPVLEQLLPGFAYVRLVSFADEALAAFMDRRNLSCTHLSSKGKKLHGKGDLFHRTECLAAHGLLEAEHTKALHRTRERRKPLAHLGHPTSPSWDELAKAINAVEEVLAALDLVEAGIRYEAVATQHPVEGVDGKLIQRFTLAVSSAGKVVREIGWRIQF